MKWSDFVAGLDDVRGEIRRDKGDLKREAVSGTDKVLDKLQALLDQARAHKPRTVMVELPVDLDGNVIYPIADKPVMTSVKYETPAGSVVKEGKHKAVVFPREEQHVHKTPVLEEVSPEEAAILGAEEEI